MNRPSLLDVCFLQLWELRPYTVPLNRSRRQFVCGLRLQ